MQSLAQIRALLESHGLSPQHRLGQNFLIDHNLLRKLVSASGIERSHEVVLEVGPGTGTLTEALLEAGCVVVACEIDSGMCRLLGATIGQSPTGDRFRLVHSDCMERKGELSARVRAELDRAMADATERAGEPRTRYRLVSNLPYGVSTPLLLALLCDEPACMAMTATIQREVAERLEARPGSAAYGTLGVVAQALARVKRVASAPATCFWPRPGVESAMVHIERLGAPGPRGLVQPDMPLTDRPADLALLCRELFSRRRKQLGSALREMGVAQPDAQGAIAHAGVEASVRAEALSPAQLVGLMRGLEVRGWWPGRAPEIRGSQPQG